MREHLPYAEKKILMHKNNNTFKKNGVDDAG